MGILCLLTAAFAILVTVVVRAIDQKQEKLEQRVKALEERPKKEKEAKEQEERDARFARRPWIGAAK